MTTTEPEVKGVRNRYSIMGLTREQKHWKAFRRGLWGTLVAFAFAGLVFLGADLDSRALWWVGFLGVLGSFIYLTHVHAELFQIWFVRGKKR